MVYNGREFNKGKSINFDDSHLANYPTRPWELASNYSLLLLIICLLKQGWWLTFPLPIREG